MTLSAELERKLKQLISYLQGKRVIVAFSGGVDSSLLAYLSSEHADETLLITERSILYPEEEIEIAEEFAKEHGIPHVIISRDPLKDDKFAANPSNRCYICKKGLYSSIKKMMASRGFDAILDGTNADDLSDHRPGMRALEELDIATPYLRFNISKEDIRSLSKYFHLQVHSKPSMACFSSRISFGETINEEKLRMIRESERFLRTEFSLSQLRVRYHENALARIEITKNEWQKVLSQENLGKIEEKLKEIGFRFVALDLEGFRSGSMNKTLNRGDLQE